ncbi:MAG: hypothetical protein FH753_17025 [Firmicutes bacterium]|nr:hypothetical protein [Bacillota bacterium]
MDINKRNKLIEEISKKRNSNLICYIAGDRQNVSTRIAPDIIPVFYKHLEDFKDKNKRIDLLLFTKGGDVLTAMRLVELIHEYTNNFSVLIPHKAYSAGTLISLGASEIVMTKMAELSPVDPNVTNVFNPKDPNNPSAKIPISVEDVYSFISLVKDIMKIEDDQSLAKVYSHLLESVHPLALGSIHRTYSLIRKVSKKILLSHMGYDKENKVNNIVDFLTEKLFSHNYMISRREAKNDIKLPVEYPYEELEYDIWNLYKQYVRDLLLEKPFSPEENANTNGRFQVSSGIIESQNRTDLYLFEGLVQKNTSSPNKPNNINIIFKGWKNIRKESS